MVQRLNIAEVNKYKYKLLLKMKYNNNARTTMQINHIIDKAQLHDKLNNALYTQIDKQLKIKRYR